MRFVSPLFDVPRKNSFLRIRLPICIQARDSNMTAHNGEISFLSTIAHALEEEDMVVGFERMRAQPTTSVSLCLLSYLNMLCCYMLGCFLQDIARRHEQASEWHDALTIYENQLTTSSDAFDEAMSGRMRCLWGLGYYQVRVS